uniref:Fibronectin type-III domain-containing protein n=1 Tax=Dicentrarchus labrax TaxID=13489 RepID=A0A8C4IT24_DICLA
HVMRKTVGYISTVLGTKGRNLRTRLTACTGSGFNASIAREHFSSHDELRVWVQAENQYGSVKSEEVVFNTADISEQTVFSLHAQTHSPFLTQEDKYFNRYEFVSHQPCTAYEFQVRCACVTGLKSYWSAIEKIHTLTDPVGKLDVWRDCGVTPASFDCVLIWKTLPMSQACDLILGYEVKLFYPNGTTVLVNVSIAEPRGQLVCDETRCHLNSSLKDATSVNVSAYNALGATEPSKLTLAIPGIFVFLLFPVINEENVTVSWDLPSISLKDLKEYVVEYKQAGCPPGQGFDWVKVNKSQRTAIFKGLFFLTYKLLGLSPGQEYEVWIRAVTSAGPGENATARFKTVESYGIASYLFLFIGMRCSLGPPCYCDKVPDPRNSYIFRDMKHQVRDQMTQQDFFVFCELLSNV